MGVKEAALSSGWQQDAEIPNLFWAPPTPKGGPPHFWGGLLDLEGGLRDKGDGPELGPPDIKGGPRGLGAGQELGKSEAKRS